MAGFGGSVKLTGESEYKKLIAGEKVKSSGYFSHDPMGWASEGWTDGFASKKDDTLS